MSTGYEGLGDGGLSRMLAAQAWCDPETQDRVMDPAIALAFAKRTDILLNSLETAWGIIASADWSKESKEWQEAAARWRDEEWHVVLDGRFPVDNGVNHARG